MKRKRVRQWIAMVLAVAMTTVSIETTGFAQTLGTEEPVQETQSQSDESQLWFSGDIKTWEDAAGVLCQLLGVSQEDAAAPQEGEEADYREILAGNGILGTEDFPEDMKESITEESWSKLTDKAFSETVRTAEDAQALRASEGSEKFLVTAPEAELSGITADCVASAGEKRLELYDSRLKELTVYNTKQLELKGVETERISLYVQEGETISLRSDDSTRISEVVLTGKGSVIIEGSGAFGRIRIKDTLQDLTVRATCSVINESEADIPLEEPDGNKNQLGVKEQKELILSGYLISFVADGNVLETKVADPGAVIEFPKNVPDKEGYLFTSWYKDEGCTENASQFEVAEGQTVYYARYISDAEAVTVQFDTQGGSPLTPVTMAKGESLLTRPVEEIYTSQDGYTFGGWCTDAECTEAFAYSQPVEEDLTLYAFFLADEAQEEEKEGNTAELQEFQWNGKIPLTVEEGMTPEEIKKGITVEAGAGEQAPEIQITEQDGTYYLSGDNYEKEGEKGFEPGSTFSLLTGEKIHFADYSEDITTLVVSVYKEQVENVVFADGMTYVLWDDVISYVPARESEEGQREEAKIEEEQNSENSAETDKEAAAGEETDKEAAAGEETDKEAPSSEETDKEAPTSEESDKEAAASEETDKEALAGEETDKETTDGEVAAEEAPVSEASASAESITDEDGEKTGSEWDLPAYIPGEVVVKGTADYKEGDLVVFYDGEIGRDEKTMDSYTEGSYDGYVLYAKVQQTEQTDEGTRITFQYASPEEYLSDFDVHMTEEANLEQELTQEDLEVLTSRLSKQVEENEELKAQMLISVMSSKETQEMINEKYGEGVYSLAAMNASLRLNRPSVKLSVSGSRVTADISVSATAVISKDGKTLMTVTPKLSFTQILEVRMNVNGGKFWIDMSVTFISTTKIALTISATSGGSVSVFEGAKKTLEELVKPEGIKGTYKEYDKTVRDLMDTMTSIVQTSLSYNDLFDITLLNLRYSFYGIITIGVEVHFVGQIGILATFGIEIVAKSGERIGFNYNFLKFKGKSYTEKLDSSVTNNIYLIGKVGVRVGVRLILSITVCGIVKTSITGSLYLYAELTGVFFFTANLLSGANSSLGALHFEVGIDVVVTLSLQVKLIFKTIRKNWTVYTGRWPLWSKSVSSKLSYVNEEKLQKQWEEQTAKADHRTSFGFTSIPMKTWNLMGGKCTENALLCGKSAGKGGNIKIAIENLVVNGEAVPSGDPKEKLFTVGDASKGQNPVAIYMDEKVAAEQLCQEAELDMVFTYENNSSSALVKKQVKRFHLKKKCAIASTTQNVKVVLYDWCARNWEMEPASWDGAEVYSTSFVSSHLLGVGYESTATGTLDLGSIVTAAQTAYPELTAYTYGWSEPTADGSRAAIQYSVPRYSDFCYMTPENGVVRYDVRANTEVYDVTYYLYVNRFEGYEDIVRYHVRIDGAKEGTDYEFSTLFRENAEPQLFTRQEDGTYLLEARRKEFDSSEQPLLMSVNGKEPVKTGFTITGREVQQDVYFDISIGTVTLGIQLGEGVESYEYADPSMVAEDGMEPGAAVELKVKLKEGYGGLEAISTNKNAAFTVKDTVVSFVMPTEDLSVTLQAYKLHTITYLYQYKGYGTYQTAYFAENEKTKEEPQPEIQGLTFRGWYTTSDFSGEPYQFGENLKTDITLYADWTCNVTVHFTPAKGTASYWQDTEGGRQEIYLFDNKEQTYYQFTYSTLRPEEKLLDIQVPEYEGYQFMGWYTDQECSTQAIDLEKYKVSGGMDIYAGWARIVDVVFDKNDGSENSVYVEMTGLEGYPLTLLPDEPKREHYTFTGWYRNAAATVPADTQNEKLTGKTTYYAGWKADSYSITYELGGGTLSEANPEAYTVEDSFTLSQPVRKGYQFEGWTGTGLKEVTRQVTVPRGSSGVRSYTAVWTAVSYTISYNRTFGSAENNPLTYTIEDDILLEQPEREKYKFEGWTGTDLEKPTLEVRIPKGSTGDRTYTAAWSTEDEILAILERVEVLADENPYEGSLIDYLSQEDFMTDVIHYEELEKKLTEEVQRRLELMVSEDEMICAYSSQIQLTANLDKEYTDRDTDKRNQKYTFRITAVYQDDDGNQTSREFPHLASLEKMEPVVWWPEASRLHYGETVADSILENGSAHFIYKEFELEMPVDGSFDWKAEEKEKVPFGRNNGTEASSYQVTFTPYRTDCFATVDGTVGVLTQIGLAVLCQADDRDYIPGNISATGTFVLVYVDEKGQLIDQMYEDAALLTSGTWSFANDKAEADKTVTFAGFVLDPEKNTTAEYGEGAYTLVDYGPQTCQASIYPIRKDNARLQITAPETAEPQYLYGTLLGDMKLKNGEVKYVLSDTESITIQGTWDWKNSEKETRPVSGTSSYTAIFTPADQYEGGYETFEGVVSVKVEKQTAAVPEIADLTYNGGAQAPVIPSSGNYTVKENTPQKAAGTYRIKLELTDPANYMWAAGAGGNVTIQDAEAVISYQILPAEVTVNVQNAATEPLLYGQKLTGANTDQKATVNGVENIVTEVTAKGKVSKYTATYKNSAGAEANANGNWSWITDSEGKLTVKTADGDVLTQQPLEAGTYQVKARFIPTDTNLKECEAYLPVTVGKSDPYVLNVPTTDSIYNSEGKEYKLSRIPIKGASLPVYNKYTGESIEGTWEWDDPDRVQSTAGSFGAHFTFNTTKSNDIYNVPKQNCSIVFRDYVVLTVNFTTGRESLYLSESDIGNKDKCGFKERNPVYTCTKKIQPGSTDGSNRQFAIVCIDFWQNICLPGSDRIIDSSKMVMVSAVGSMNQDNIGSLPFIFSEKSAGIWLYAEEGSTEFYSLLVDMNGTDLGDAYGDVEITVTVDVKDPDYYAGLQKGDSSREVKARKAKKKVKVSPSATPVPEAPEVTPTETPQPTLSPVPETPEVTPTETPQPAISPVPEAPEVTPTEIPQPTIPEPTAAPQPEAEITPTPEPAVPEEASAPEPTALPAEPEAEAPAEQPLAEEAAPESLSSEQG